MSAQGQDLFKNLYRERLQSLSERARDEGDSSFADLRRAEFARPDSIKEQYWERLNGAQRASRYVDAWRKFSTGRAEELGLTESDFLRMTFSSLEISERAADVAVSLIGCGLSNPKNPTIVALVERINRAVSTGEPLRCVVSQCIAKAPQVRPAKLEYFLGLDRAERQIERFTDGLEKKGWVRLKEILSKVDYPLQITMMLGDMDLLTIDGAAGWASPESLRRLGKELREVTETVAQEAQREFGGSIAVSGWSSRYSMREFSSALTQARDLSRWSDRDLFVTSSALYQQYGYRDLQRSLGVSAERMDQFIVDDVVRTAAQYRLEADIALRGDAIQLWAESVPDRIWPIRISNYDGAGYVPAVALI